MPKSALTAFQRSTVSEYRRLRTIYISLLEEQKIYWFRLETHDLYFNGEASAPRAQVKAEKLQGKKRAKALKDLYKELRKLKRAIKKMELTPDLRQIHDDILHDAID